MLFGWRSVRHMKRGLPKSELQRLDAFYNDFGLWQGFLKVKEPGSDDPSHPADDLGDWDAEKIQGPMIK
jgi:hypothetical protein